MISPVVYSPLGSMTVSFSSMAFSISKVDKIDAALMNRVESAK